MLANTVYQLAASTSITTVRGPQELMDSDRIYIDNPLPLLRPMMPALANAASKVLHQANAASDVLRPPAPHNAVMPAAVPHPQVFANGANTARPLRQAAPAPAPPRTDDQNTIALQRKERQVRELERKLLETEQQKSAAQKNMKYLQVQAAKTSAEPSTGASSAKTASLLAQSVNGSATTAKKAPAQKRKAAAGGGRGKRGKQREAIEAEQEHNENNPEPGTAAGEPVSFRSFG